jgi:hypothetical protein
VTKKPEERLGSVIAIRLSEKVKAILIKEAHAEKKSLSNYLFNLINAGREATRESGLANGEGANEAEMRAWKVEAENVNFSKLLRTAKLMQRNSTVLACVCGLFVEAMYCITYVAFYNAENR